MVSFRLDSLIASQSSLSDFDPKGSKFFFIVPLNKNGVSGITEIFCLKECNPILKVSNPPIS